MTYDAITRRWNRDDVSTHFYHNNTNNDNLDGIMSTKFQSQRK